MKRKTLGAALTAGVLVLASVVPAARADDLFSATATPGGGPPVAESRGDLLGLVRDVVEARHDFSGLFGQSFTSTFTYAGVPNALQISENSSGTSATLQIGPNAPVTFTGTDPRDLKNQIQDFLTGNGGHEYSQYLKTIDATSSAASLDGNPTSATAFAANDAYRRWGIQSTPSISWSRGLTAFRVDGGIDIINSQPGNGYQVWAAFEGDFQLIIPNMQLASATAVQARVIGNAESDTITEELGLPISILQPQGDGLSWQLTPWAQVGLNDSFDMVAGGVFGGGGLTSSASLRYKFITLTLANQVSYATDVPTANVGWFTYETPVDRPMFKNGVKVSVQPLPGLFFDAGVTETHLVHAAAVKDFWSPELGVGVALGSNAAVRIGLEGDYGPNHYDVTGANVIFTINY